MTSESQRPRAEIRAKFAEMKRSLAGLAPAERIAQELRFARELGLTVTATEAASIVRPMQNRFRADAALMSAPGAVCAAADREGGQGVDLSMRRTAAEVLRLSAFTPSPHSGEVRELIKSLRGPVDLEAMVVRLSAQLDLVTARGDQLDLARDSLSALEQTVFSSADPLKSKKGVGGESNA